MPLIPNPFNSVQRPDGLMCFCVDDDPDFGGDGFKTVMIVARAQTNLPWGYFGNVWLDAWPPARLESFQAWFAEIVRVANLRVRENTGEPGVAAAAACPAPSPGADAPWDEVKAWLVANVRWEATPGGWQLVPGRQGVPVDPQQPTPTPSAGRPGNGWVQFQAGQQDLALRTFVDPADGVQKVAFYRKDGPGQFTWLPFATTRPP